MGTPVAESVEDNVRVLREGFESGINNSLENRKKHLKVLKDMLLENEEAFVQAVFEDLRKAFHLLTNSPKFEVLAHELLHIVSDIDSALSNLKSWTAPARATRYLLQATDAAYTIKEPLGTVLIIGAFNFPLQLLFGPLVGAIAAGCTILLRPSETAAATERLVLDLVKKYFDPGMIKAVHADKDGMTRILKLRFDHIFFTGSTTVGKVVMEAAAKHLAPVTLDPAVIDQDFDVTIAARRVCWGKFMNAGQVCVAPDYAIVIGNEERRSAFTAECTKIILEFYGADPQKSEDFGRIIDQKGFERLRKVIESTAGKVIYGGQHNADERYIQPTVIEANEDDSTMKEELFGPILPVLQLPSLDDAIKFIKRREKPLVSYLFADAKKSVQRFEADVSSGSMRYPPFNQDKLVWARRLTSKIRMPF
ncbi:Aldehyde dehydrogenase [Aphelenchoides fujianensis]|nr:Aldehyde dehydrogenase [Aphelenchoides fujianensis]